MPGKTLRICFKGDLPSELDKAFSAPGLGFVTGVVTALVDEDVMAVQLCMPGNPKYSFTVCDGPRPGIGAHITLTTTEEDCAGSIEFKKKL